MAESEERSVKLRRRQAMKRKDYIRGDHTQGLSRIDEKTTLTRIRRYSDNSMDESEERRVRGLSQLFGHDLLYGSSLDLTPTLLGIYDKIASANKSGELDPTDQSECDYFLTNENLEDGAEDQCHSPGTSPILSRRPFYQSHDCHQPIGRAYSDPFSDNSSNELKMEGSENKEPSSKTDSDNKKRPLSISSMSSSSTSSLPRRRKRPNLNEFSDTQSSDRFDIEKLDNLLYIDDGPDHEILEMRNDDDISMCSEDKFKSVGDSDSQLSADHSLSGGDQSEGLNSTMSFHQSDSSLSFTPSTSANCSTADLSMNSDVNIDGLHHSIPSRSSQRSSQKSPGVSRSGSSSFKQTGHYVSYVQRVVTEIVETERVYVDHLQDIKVGYYQYIVDHPAVKISIMERECLFGNIGEIYKFSCGFLSELEQCSMDPVKVAQCFVQNNAGFAIYAEYCTNYPSAVGVLTRVMQDLGLNEVFKQRQLALSHSLPLGAYLLKPVQRVLKYHLLLQNILKHYSSTDPGYETLSMALDHMTDMSHHINEMKRKHEHAVRVQEIQSQLEDYEGEDFTRLGELVLEGSFRMYGVKASRQMFLFNRGVIIAKRKEDGMLSCKTFIPCATLMLVESIPKEPLNFQILPFDNPRGANTIHARNLDQKRKWCQEIKRLILASYASKIPDNVKDLIIEKLGKSKEEDNISHGSTVEPGKSHVTTPEYLEKRLKARRKSGTALISEILKPQRARKLQLAKNRNDSSSPKSSPTLESLMYAKEASRNNSNDVTHYGYRTQLPGASKVSPLADKPGPTPSSEPRIYSSKSPSTKRTSVHRSHSFQTANARNSINAESLLKDYLNQESAASMENLSQPNGPVLRTNSFRKATRISPIRCDSVDGVDGEAGENDTDQRVNGILTSQKNLDNIPASVKRSIDKELNKFDHSLSVREVSPGGDDQENLNGSYIEEMGFRKRGRYASMPVLNGEMTKSPKVSRIASESGKHDCRPNHRNMTSSSIHHARCIDIKPYFSQNQDKQSLLKDKSDETDQGTNRDSKPVTAFNDAFIGMRKSNENLYSKGSSENKLSLTQPKPFSSTLRTSATMLSSHAKLNKWTNQDRFNKGSLTDVSHLKDDPWIRDKQRSYTESRLQPFRDRHREKLLRNSTPEQPNHEKLASKQAERLSLNVDGLEDRMNGVNSDDRSFSRDNLDWLVYANRNSLPVSGFSTEELSRSSKYCTPPRGSMVPPPAFSRDVVGPLAKTPLHQNVVSTFGSPSRFELDSSMEGYPKSLRVSQGDSTVSLSATNSSSDTCSSPDILKDAVFEDCSSGEKASNDRSHLSRSYSTSDAKRGDKVRKHLHEQRPASVDILEEAGHIEESEKLVAEMEHYMRRSTSSSGSLNSSKKFPKAIPTFEKKHHSVEPRNKNRDSIASNGSASSYESTGPEVIEGGIVDSIRHKITNITSKFTGKKLSTSDLSSHPQGISPPTSPSKYKQEDHPTKIMPTISHSLSLKMKGGQPKNTNPDLPTILREKELGSASIGSRMANTDLDDYATFSLPRSQFSSSELKVVDSEKSPKLKETMPKSKTKQYGRYSNSNLSVPGPNDSSNTEFHTKSQSKLYSPITSMKNLNIQQSDSAFSIQSGDIDSSSPDDSPREESGDTPDSAKLGESSETFYERRLSAVFSNDDAFRDSAVYCDDLDSVPSPTPQDEFIPAKLPIKAYVQQLEEKNKPKQNMPLKIKAKEPGAIIKQRMESLAANADQRNKSCSTSRSMSSTTSRTHSRSSSRASSEEKQLTNFSLREYMDHKFPPMEGVMDRSLCDGTLYRGRLSSEGSPKLKPAFSLGRLDQLTSDVDNLVIMKGWVKELIGKFQTNK